MSPLSFRSSARPTAGALRQPGPTSTSEPWDARRVFLANLVVLGVVVCFAMIYRFAAALFILFVGVTLGMAVRPGVERLRRMGVSRWAGALAVYLALGCVFAGILILAVPVIAEQASALLARGPHHAIRLRELLFSSDSHTLRRIAAYLPSSLGGTGGDATGALDIGTVVGYGGAVGRNVFTIAAVLLLGFYWTLEGDRQIRALSIFAPFDRRRAVRAFFGDIEQTVGSYVRGQSVVCLVIGLLAFMIYSLLGVPHAPVLGLIYALGETVPVVGPIFCTAVVSLVALSVNPSLVVAVIAAAAFLQLVENYVLIPHVMKRTVGVNPLVTLLAITAFGSVLGIAGAVFAIPMAAIVQLMLSRWLFGDEARQAQPPEGRDRLSVVQYEVRELTSDVRKLLRLRDERRRPPDQAERLEDALEGIGQDLDRILGTKGQHPS